MLMQEYRYNNISCGISSVPLYDMEYKRQLCTVWNDCGCSSSKLLGSGHMQ